MVEFAALIATILILSIPLFALWSHHRRKVLEIQLQVRGQGEGGVRAELDSLRQEMRALRDTSMQYDLSFDTALQQMERRVNKIERVSFLGSESPTQHNISLGGR